jgi:uncharacterized membrane protein HdeD (DUF308 family)
MMTIPATWLIILSCVFPSVFPSHAYAEVLRAAGTSHAHDGIHDHGMGPGGAERSGERWEGSVAGKAYSEFNHHLAGILVLVIGLTELAMVLGFTTLSWIRFLLPAALAVTGCFLLIWSDHEAWPIGPLSFSETYFGGDWETFQHKLFGILALAVGIAETLRRLDTLRHPGWRVPLPAFAILGGVSLFLHSHGVHPAAHKIAQHHAIMGAMAVTAGSSKLAAWRRPASSRRSRRELLWSALVILIGIQLLFYSE